MNQARPSQSAQRSHAPAGEPQLPVLYTWMDSPVAPLLLVSDGDALTGLHMAGARGTPTVQSHWRQDAAHFFTASCQLTEYLNGERTEFDLPLAPEGTPFQRKVWDALLTIAFGQTLSYGTLARQVGSDQGARAIGGAVGRNPISIVIPCHRVVGSDGALTGYGGGLDRKTWLLRHEGALETAPPRSVPPVWRSVPRPDTSST